MKANTSNFAGTDEKFLWLKNSHEWALSCDGTQILEIPIIDNVEDTFKCIEAGVWCWTRRVSTAVTEMRMDLQTRFKVKFWMVPAVNYNGNGWGSSTEYLGDKFEGKPWIYAWHRSSLPACTYAEGTEYAVALHGNAHGGMSCSLHLKGTNSLHSLIWPEQEGPKCLSKRRWQQAYCRDMTPQNTFSAIIVVHSVDEPRNNFRHVMDFAWRYMSHSQKPEKDSALLWKLGISYAKLLWKKEGFSSTEKEAGLTGFRSGMWWDYEECLYRYTFDYDIGWIGQNASLANSFLVDYLRNGDQDSLDKGLAVLDSWTNKRLASGLLLVRFNSDFWFESDACNNGTAAEQFFLASKLAEQCGQSHPEYLKVAMGICDFTVKVQKPDGSLAKSWNLDGSERQSGGTVGIFLIKPLLTAYKTSGKKTYLNSARRAFNYYYDEFLKNGFTTSGALDSYCIDKESASPMLAVALELYTLCKDDHYLNAAERVAWYLATWQWHYSVVYPENTVLAQLHYDTQGATGVSTAHNAVDQYALRDVLPLIELSRLTGNRQWHERAMSIWCNTSQLISDGTYCFMGHIRPAGSQDEAVCHTNWARLNDDRVFIPSQYLNVWPAAFRLEILRQLNDWSLLDSGFQ